MKLLWNSNEKAMKLRVTSYVHLLVPFHTLLCQTFGVPKLLSHFNTSNSLQSNANEALERKKDGAL